MQKQPFYFVFQNKLGPLVPYTKFIIQKKDKGRPTRAEKLFCGPLEKLWPNGRPLSKPKLEHFKSMMNLNPADVKLFYKNLHSNLNVVDDIDGFNVESLDFYLELEEV